MSRALSPHRSTRIGPVVPILSGGACLVGLGVALVPPRAATPSYEPIASAGADPGYLGVADLGLAAFATPLWVAPPAPPPAPKPPLPPPPLDLQLIAVVASGGERRAVIYDPAADMLVPLGTGDSHAGCFVQSVGPDHVRVVYAGSERTLYLPGLGVSP